jgi:hypothetical protein
MKVNIDYIGTYTVAFFEALKDAGLEVTAQEGCWDKNNGTVPVFGPDWIKGAIDQFYEIGSRGNWSVDMLNNHSVIAEYIVGCNPEKEKE